GRIQPQPLLEALARGGAQDNEICLELSFKEREPTDSNVVAEIAESVAFWADHIDTGVQDLHLA
ncbi:aminotransferase, partial [Pantoea dispersa]